MKFTARGVVCATIAAGAFFLAAIQLRAQATTGEIHGTVVDSTNAVIPNAQVTLTNEGQSAVVRQVLTLADGNFLLTPLLPGTYTLTVTAAGFKKYTQTGIVLNVNDKLGLPPIVLEVGQAAESVNVQASTVALETVTAERSGLVNGRQMVDLPLNGRNYTTLLETIPGSAGNFGGNPNVNGQSNFQNNYTVDGQTVTDIGVNQQFAYRINVDAIAELKVSTNSQAAEFGRASGAQIQTVTKSGTKQFHGTGWWFKRGEFMNANDFIRNESGAPRSIYRFMQAGFNIGGPVILPWGLNKDHNKLFFFASNEWGRSETPTNLYQITVPTAQERHGNFQDAVNAGGVVQTVYDPTTRSAANPQGTPFPNNIIPQSMWSPYGPQVLDWLPLPNVLNNPAYNYQSQVPASAPTYDQVYRGDYDISDNWRAYGRAVISKSTQNNPYGRADSGNLLGLSPLYAPTYGWALNFDVATVLSPTLTNDFLFGYAVNGIPGDAPPANSPYYRANSGITIPLLYPNADPSHLIPNFSFVGIPGPSGAQFTTFSGLPYANRNPIWDATDNITKVVGAHTFKAGIFYEYAVKTESPFKPINSTIYFDTNSQNPGDTNWPFANALLGNFNKYVQPNTYLAPDYRYENIEWYGQDTWKINAHLTINYGLRMNVVLPFVDDKRDMSDFLRSAYNPSQAVSYYVPTLAGGQRIALNPLTGATAAPALIGDIVPNSGTLYNGIVLEGQNGMPLGLLKDRGIQWGPRFGLAYNFGKNVLRVGGGVFYDRVTTFEIGTTSNYVTNPPTLVQSQILYGNLATIPSASTVNVPATITGISPDGHVPTVYNYSAGIQRQLPFATLLDVSYVGSESRHLPEQDPFNYVPFGSAWLPQNQDPTVGAPQYNGTTTLPTQLYRPYAGYTSGSYYTFGSSSNYNALQVAVNHRVGAGLTFGVSYSWAKALGIPGPSSGTPGVGSILNTRAYNYGPLGFDVPQTLVINYIYNLPNVSRAGFLSNAAARTVLNGWQLGGLVNIARGTPVNPTYTISGVSAATLNREITGSEDIAPRVRLTCDPNLSMGARNINEYINTSCFAPAAVGSVADDSGINTLRGPGINQWDMALYKRVNFTERAYAQLRLEAFNALNHPEFASFNSTIVFNSAGQIINLPSQLGGTGGRFGFGALNATRANSNRILQIAAKFYF
ncbi:MAG TPA: carboxypeptidase regulatory-like domain-containing protein [Bryobacteraceae bacterium]|nr:carboxypeptidase regulatory-like domain-containing protein [Bryobacteraceae bacterium]